MILEPRQRYESALASARRLLEEAPATRAQLDPNIDPALLLRFLIQFSAWGVQMTESVEHWIRRAGERCMALGLDDVGRALVSHAKHEAGHHLMLMEDTKVLVRRWNTRSAIQLDADRLQRQRATPAMQRYIELHERTIASDMPFGQVAIELEIEGMSTTLGKAFIALCRKVLGPEVLDGLSFIREHVAIDVGHTAFNTRLMDRLLTSRPECAERLAEIGSEALRTYVEFFAECLGVATYDVSRAQWAAGHLPAEFSVMSSDAM